MARSKGVEELADASQVHGLRAQALSAAEDRLAAECTFQPDTRKPVIADAQYTAAKAVFAVHNQEPEDLVQRCGSASLLCGVTARFGMNCHMRLVLYETRAGKIRSGCTYCADHVQDGRVSRRQSSETRRDQDSAAV